jgi:hypothetical protein
MLTKAELITIMSMMEMAMNEEYIYCDFADEDAFVGLHNYLVTYMKIRSWLKDMEKDEQ